MSVLFANDVICTLLVKSLDAMNIYDRVNKFNTDTDIQLKPRKHLFVKYKQ